jgi:hypothetical protein
VSYAWVIEGFPLCSKVVRETGDVTKELAAEGATLITFLTGCFAWIFMCLAAQRWKKLNSEQPREAQ